MASSVTAELLKQLSVASDALNSASDQFNQQIRTIEEALASYNLGVPAWVTAFSGKEEEYDDGGTVIDKYTRLVRVGYEKSGGAWSLMVAVTIPERSHLREWVLRDAPRDLRMQAIDGIPLLLEKLIDEANALTGQISRKTAEARTLAASIKPRKEQ